MAADDRSVIATGHDRLDEAELAEAPFEGVELVVADPARVGRIGSEIVDRDQIDRGRCRGRYHGDRPLFAAPGAKAAPTAAVLAALMSDEFRATYRGLERAEYVRVLAAIVADLGGALDTGPAGVAVEFDDRRITIQFGTG